MLSLSSESIFTCQTADVRSLRSSATSVPVTSDLSHFGPILVHYKPNEMHYVAVRRGYQYPAILLLHKCYSVWCIKMCHNIVVKLTVIFCAVECYWMCTNYILQHSANMTNILCQLWQINQCYMYKSNSITCSSHQNDAWSLKKNQSYTLAAEINTSLQAKNLTKFLPRQDSENSMHTAKIRNSG